MTNSRISIERNEGRIELKTLKTDEWTFLEEEPRYAVSVLDEEEARALLQQLITALAGPQPEHLTANNSYSWLLTRAEESSVRVLLDTSVPEAILVFSALCFTFQHSQPGSLNRAEFPHLISKVIRAISAVDSSAEDHMKRWFEESKSAMSQDV